MHSQPSPPCFSLSKLRAIGWFTLLLPHISIPIGLVLLRPIGLWLFGLDIFVPWHTVPLGAVCCSILICLTQAWALHEAPGNFRVGAIENVLEIGRRTVPLSSVSLPRRVAIRAKNDHVREALEAYVDGQLKVIYGIDHSMSSSTRARMGEFVSYINDAIQWQQIHLPCAEGDRAPYRSETGDRTR